MEQIETRGQPKVEPLSQQLIKLRRVEEAQRCVYSCAVHEEREEERNSQRRIKAKLMHFAPITRDMNKE